MRKGFHTEALPNAAQAGTLQNSPSHLQRVWEQIQVFKSTKQAPPVARQKEKGGASVQNMRQELRKSGQARTRPLEREAVSLWRVRQRLHSRVGFTGAPEAAYWRKAVPVRDMWETLHAMQHPSHSQEGSLRTEALEVQHV